jgi:hypothetical protein
LLYVGTHVPAARNTHKTIEELFNVSFSLLSTSYQRKGGDSFGPEHVFIFILINGDFLLLSRKCDSELRQTLKRKLEWTPVLSESVTDVSSTDINNACEEKIVTMPAAGYWPN